MARPHDWHPAADVDPCPGDASAARELANRCKQVAEAIRTATDGVDRIHHEVASGASEGLSVDALVSLTGDTAAKVGRVQPRYQAMAEAMFSWAGTLEDLQSRAGQVLDRAQRAEADRLLYTPLRDAAVDDSERARYQRLVDEAVAAITTEQVNARTIHREWDDAGNARVDGIKEVIKKDDLNDGFWDKVGDVVSVVADVAGKISAYAGIAALAVGWIPVIGQAAAGILGTIALAAAAVTLVAQAGLITFSDRGSWSELGLAAFTVATFGVGRAAATLAKGSTLGARAVARIGTTRALKDGGLTHSQAVSRMKSMLGPANGATHHAKAAAPTKLLPSVKDGLRLGYGGIGRGVADDVAKIRGTFQGGFGGGVSQIRAGFSGYGSGGGALSARVLGMHDNAAEISRLGTTRASMASVLDDLRPGDLSQLKELTRQGAGQVRIAQGASALSGGVDTVTTAT